MSVSHSQYNTGSTEGQYAKTVDKNGKGKGRRATPHWRQTAGNRSIALLIPKLGDKRVGKQRHSPAALCLGEGEGEKEREREGEREKAGVTCTEGWVGLRVGPTGCGKSRPHRCSNSEPSTP